MSFQKERLNRLREKMGELQLEAFLATSLSSIRYLSGFSGSSGVVLVTEEEAYLITDFRYQEQSRDEVKDFTEICVSNNPFWEILQEKGLLKSGIKIGYESLSLTMHQYQKLESVFNEAEFVPTENLIEELSAVKDKRELEALKKAVEITDRVFEELVDYIKSGLTEKEIAARLCYLVRLHGGDREAFDPIVASGPNSALPHARPTERRLKKGDILLLDFGAVYDGYHADMTRTLVAGKPMDKHYELHEIVREAQEKAIQAAREGVSCKELDGIARDYITRKGYGNFFGHSLGHGIGLEVHAFPRVSNKSEAILKQGMVITVEPGIYLPGFGGFRIEDDVVVNADGATVLNQASKELIPIQ